jgi:hypothetical protein
MILCTWRFLRRRPNIRLEKLSENMKNPSQDRKYPDRNSNSVPPQCDTVNYHYTNMLGHITRRQMGKNILKTCVVDPLVPSKFKTWWVIT